MTTPITDDRRAKLREAAARVRASMSPEFRRMSAQEIMEFLRGASPPPSDKDRGHRQPD